MLNYKFAWQKILLMVAYLKSKTIRKKKRSYKCTALTNRAQNRIVNNIIFYRLLIIDNIILVGRVGYAPTTPAMSMQYSTIELTAQ